MPRQLVTRKRAAWAESRGGVAFKGKTLNYNAAIGDRYVRALVSLVKQMTQQTIRDVRKLYDTHATDSAMDASIASQARILTNQLTAKFEALFSRRAKDLADSMVSASNKASKSALYTSLKELSGGLSLKTDLMSTSIRTVMTASVAENVALIKSIPSQFMTDVTGEVLRSITSGRGLADLVPALEQYEGVTIRRATNIALDQTRKAYNNINRGRMEAIGVRKFEWIHSGGGQKPRQEHIDMDGNVYSFDDPPIIDPKTGERGIPGQAINCRCSMRPVLDFGAPDE